MLEDAYPELIKIAGGTFTMGNNQSEYSDEKPERIVSISDFYLGKYPVTNSQYAIFLNQYGSDTVLKGDHEGQKMIEPDEWGVLNEGKAWQAAEGCEDHPVINVTWYGAHTFCQWLSEKSGHQYALPSEAQWEYAARSGIHTEAHSLIYAGSNKLKEVGWYDENSHQKTKAVGLKMPNQLGLYDMSGNVFEWCEDRWHANYDDAPLDGKAWLENGDENLRVIRGGSWLNYDFNCRVSIRNGFNADLRFNDIGFRVSRY
ncbi:MAG: formylglycine-generating enzyme family protein [Bacteroidota bacterium]